MWPFTRMIATRTRPESLSASRRKRRPALECLEEKQLLSIVFGADSNGTYAFNSSNLSRVAINSAVPTAMTEGADGTLFASYNSNGWQGTYRYDYSSGQWTGLTSWTSTAMSAGQDNSLFVTLNGHGTWELYGGTWTHMASHDALLLAAVNSNNAFASFGGSDYGTWADVNNAWKEINPGAVPIAMDASSDGTLFVSYAGNSSAGGYGTYSFTNEYGWYQITPDVANSIASLYDGWYIGSYPDGTFEGSDYYKGNEITSELATQLGHSGDHNTVIGSWSSGTYVWDGNWEYVGPQSIYVA